MQTNQTEKYTDPKTKKVFKIVPIDRNDCHSIDDKIECYFWNLWAPCPKPSACTTKDVVYIEDTETESQNTPMEVFEEKIHVEETQPAATGTKHDSGKLRFDIFPPEALIEVTKVFTYGENKYPSIVDESGKTVLNWKKLPNAEDRLFAAGLRHAYKHRTGEILDSESGLAHLAHATSCFTMLLQLLIEKGEVPNAGKF